MLVMMLVVGFRGEFSLAFLADTHVLGVCLSVTYILVWIPVTEIIDKRGIYVPIHALISV